MAASNRATQEQMLRTVYLDRMRKQFSVKAILLQALSRIIDTKKQGLEFSWALHSAMGGSYMWSRGGLLPSVRPEGVERATGRMAWLTNRIELMKDFVEDTGTPGGAETSILDFETKAKVASMKRDLNFDMFQDGSGKLAAPASASSGTAITVTDKRGFRDNLVIDIVLLSNGQVGPGGVIGAPIKFNHTTGVITLQEGKVLADGTGADVTANPTLYMIYRNGSRNDAFYGLGAVVSDSNPPTGVTFYGGIDRSSAANAFWQAVRHHNGGTPRTLKFKLMQDIWDDLDNRSDGEINLVVCPQDLWSHIAEGMETKRRYGAELVKLNGWADAVSVQGKYIVKDKMCQGGKMYHLATDLLSIYQTSEGEWDDYGGSVIQPLEGKMGYQAKFSRRLQTICRACNGNGVLEDLQYAAGGIS